MTRALAILAASVIVGSVAAAKENHQPYKGLETREISSLSEQDIEALTEGSGWGLALPAELNGYPGPAHVLELGDQLDLSDKQRRDVTAIFEDMQKDAVATGEILIAAERALDQGFKSGSLDAKSLRVLIAKAETARADLRYVHLSRHLATAEILDGEQVALYAKLRGYTSDPCSSVPEGHDATMWRRHNGCDDL